MPFVYSHLVGREVDTSSEEWKHECEVTFVAAMSPQLRNSYLEGVPGTGNRGVIAIRGQAAADRLLDDVRRFAELRRAGPH
jgi:hypothetical protein